MADIPTNAQSAIISRQALIDSVLDVLPRSLSDQHKLQLKQLIPAYFADVPVEDLAGLSPDDLAGTALSHWQLAKTLIKRKPKQLIFNPSFDVHGWQSAHTIIQVISADQPWLVSSLQACLDRAGHTVHRIIHPILNVDRDKNGTWLSVKSTQTKESHSESLIHIEIDAISESKHSAIKSTIDQLFTTLALIQVQTTVMSEHMAAIADSLPNTEHAQFVRWLDKEQFACFGYTQLLASDGFSEFHNSAGILDCTLISPSWNIASLLPAGLDATQINQTFCEETLVICKAGQASPIMRNEPADLVIKASCDNSGKVATLECIVGLFISGLQNESVINIPWMRERVERVISASGANPDSHIGKAI